MLLGSSARKCKESATGQVVKIKACAHLVLPAFDVASRDDA
jgi:hypothetical protein